MPVPEYPSGIKAPYQLATKTGAYTLAASTDKVILVNGTTLTMTLPSAVTASLGTVFFIRNIHASSTATVDSLGGNINGVATATILAGSMLSFINDGTNWYTLEPAVAAASGGATFAGIYQYGVDW